VKCVIPCAGRSGRMGYIPKHLIRINDKPLLKHVVDMWADSVSEYIFVLRKSMTYIWEFLPDNSAVVFQDEPKGLSDAILRTEPYINGNFVVALGDCIQRGEFKLPKGDFNLGIGVWKDWDLGELNKNYSVEECKGSIVKLTEKPKLPILPKTAHLGCGMGTYFLDKRIFEYIKEVLPKLNYSGGDFTEVLQYMILKGEKILPIYFTGKYVNITSPEDIKKAEESLSE